MKLKISKFVIFILAVITFLPLTASAIVYETFGIKPTTGNSWFTYNLKLGQTIKDSVTVMNNSKKTTTFLVYPADLAKSLDGGFAVKQKADPMTDIGSWIKLDKSEVTLKPDSTEKISFTLSVPNDPKLDAGEHAGAITIEEKTGTPSPENTNLIIHKRIGARVYVTLPGDVIRQIDLQNFTKKFVGWRLFVPDKYLFALQFYNAGNVSNSVKLTLKIKNRITGNTTTQEHTQFITRETTGINNFEWNAPFIGFYSISVTGDYKGDKNDQQFNSNSINAYVIPWDLIVLLIILAAGGYYGNKKYKKTISGHGWIQYQIQHNDTLTSIADSHHVSWKKLAKVNKIKAPYTLEKDSHILVPSEPTSLK